MPVELPGKKLAKLRLYLAFMWTHPGKKSSVHGLLIFGQWLVPESMNAQLDLYHAAVR